VPGTPGNVQVSGVTNTSISLSWTASSGTVTGYHVYEGATLKATVTATSATVSGLTACTSHTYTVKAYNGTGESGGANATGTTSGCVTAACPSTCSRVLAELRQRRHRAELASVPTTYDLIAVAFADADPNNAGGVTFNVDSGSPRPSAATPTPS